MKRIKLNRVAGEKKRLTKKKMIIIGIIGLIVLAGAGFGVKTFLLKPEIPEDIAYVPVTIQDIERAVSSKGEILSTLDEKKTPRTSYKLKKIDVVEGEAVEEGEVILEYTNGHTMDAPYNCVVKKWSLPDPEKTLTNDHYVEISGTDVLKISLEVNEDEVRLIKKGDPAKIKVGATNSTYEGEVSFVSDVGNYSGGTSTFKVDVTFDNDGQVKLGMNGKAKIILEKSEDALCVPPSAITEDGKKSYVTVKKGDNSKIVEVEKGIENDDYVEIKKGLKKTDEVQVINEPDEDDMEMGYY